MKWNKATDQNLPGAPEENLGAPELWSLEEGDWPEPRSHRPF